jgi:hypothetical protein
MSLTIQLMIPFSNDPALMHQHSPYHGIGRNMAGAQPGQLQTAMHIYFRGIQAVKIPIFNMKILLIFIYGHTTGAKRAISSFDTSLRRKRSRPDR